MAQSNSELIFALRETANRLADGARYEWGHMGRCNCGHLIQTLTDMSDYEIVKCVNFQMGEWTEHAKDYCEGTGQNVDDIFLTLHSFGFSYEDVIHLENLSDKRILSRLGEGPQYLSRNDRQDVTLYLRTMANLLEEELV